MSWFKKILGSKGEVETPKPDLSGFPNPAKPLPKGITKDNWRTFIERNACALEVGGFRPTGDLLTTVFGDIRVALPHEEWPVFKDKPLWPLCQLNLNEASYVPNALKDLKLITIFVDLEIIGNAPDVIDTKRDQTGMAMIIRTYNNLEGLEAIEQADHVSHMKPFESKWLEPKIDYPVHDTMPFDFDLLEVGNYYDHDDCNNIQATKLGGWPGTIQSEPWWDYKHNELEFEYVIQLETEPKSQWGGWGDGAAYLARSQKQPHIWALDIQFT